MLFRSSIKQWTLFLLLMPLCISRVIFGIPCKSWDLVPEWCWWDKTGQSCFTDSWFAKFFLQGCAKKKIESFISLSLFICGTVVGLIESRQITQLARNRPKGHNYVSPLSSEAIRISSACFMLEIQVWLGEAVLIYVLKPMSRCLRKYYMLPEMLWHNYK